MQHTWSVWNLWEKQFALKPRSVCALWERAIVAPQKKPISPFCVVPSLSQKMGQNLVYNYSCKQFEVLQSQKMKPYPPPRCVFLNVQKSPRNGLQFWGAVLTKFLSQSLDKNWVSNWPKSRVLFFYTGELLQIPKAIICKILKITYFT